MSRAPAGVYTKEQHVTCSVTFFLGEKAQAVVGETPPQGCAVTRARVSLFVLWGSTAPLCDVDEHPDTVKTSIVSNDTSLMVKRGA